MIVMKRKLIVAGREYEVELSEDERSGCVGSERFLIEHVKFSGSGPIFLIVNGIPYQTSLESDGDNYLVSLNGKTYKIYPIDNTAFGVVSSTRPAEDVGERTLKASMPGMVVDIKVKIGDCVKKGDPILILEAMKMENEVRAPISGKVEHVFVEVGASVNGKDELVKIKS